MLVVVDAGARYGIHPSWTTFSGPLKYLAFEPDPDEAGRLQRLYRHPKLEVIPAALGAKIGNARLHLTVHRGYSSFLSVDSRSEWFGRYRPGEGRLDRVITVPVDTIDRFCSSRGIHADFLKVDTEGTELDVVRGARRQLASSILGVRVNVSFQPAFVGHQLFPEIQNWLSQCGFMLLNMDYFGRGIPRNSLFRSPDPLVPDLERFGILLSTDAVWIKNDDAIFAGSAPAASLRTLKMATFCLLNHAPDVGIDFLLQYVKRHGRFPSSVEETELFQWLRWKAVEFLGRWRVYPDVQWKVVQKMARTIFGLELRPGHAYWELVSKLNPSRSRGA